MSADGRPTGTGAVLEVRDLSVALRTSHGIRRAVNGISFSIGQGEILGIAGESGSGKTLTALSLLGLLPLGARTSGSVRFEEMCIRDRAKGLSEWTVIRRHVMRPALLPIATVASLAFGSLLSGTVLVENIFSWPGIGEYAYLSAINLDLPAIMGVSIVVAIIYIITNLLVDLLYSVLDPRIELR